MLQHCPHPVSRAPTGVLSLPTDGPLLVWGCVDLVYWRSGLGGMSWQYEVSVPALRLFLGLFRDCFHSDKSLKHTPNVHMPYTQVTLSTRDISRPATVRLIPPFTLHGLLMSLFFKCACITQQLYFVQLNPPSTTFICLLCAHSVPRACMTLWPNMFVWFYLLRAKRLVFVSVLCLFCCT